MDALHCLAQRAEHGFRRVVRANDETHVDDDFALEQRAVNDRLGFGILAKRVVFNISRNANDLQPRTGGTRPAIPDALTDGILAGPIAPREGFADHHDARSRKRIPHGKVAALHQRNSHGVEIVRANLLVINRVGFGVGDRRMPFDEKAALEAAPKKWIDECGCCGFDSGKLCDALSQFWTVTISAVTFILSIRNIESQSHKMVRLKTGTVLE